MGKNPERLLVFSLNSQILSFIRPQAVTADFMTAPANVYLTSYLHKFYSQMSHAANICKIILYSPLPYMCLSGESWFAEHMNEFWAAEEERQVSGSEVKSGPTVARQEKQSSRMYL